MKSIFRTISSIELPIWTYKNNKEKICFHSVGFVEEITAIFKKFPRFRVARVVCFCIPAFKSSGVLFFQSSSVLFFKWYKRWCCSQWSFTQSTSNDVSGHYIHYYFPFFFFSHSPLSFFPFLLRLLFSRKECLNQKLNQQKSMGEPKNQKPLQTPLSIIGSPGNHFGFLTFSLK